MAGLKSHPFFAPIDWPRLAARSVPAPIKLGLVGTQYCLSVFGTDPYRCLIAGPDDTTHFDTFYTAEPVNTDLRHAHTQASLCLHGVIYRPIMNAAGSGCSRGRGIPRPQQWHSHTAPAAATAANQSETAEASGRNATRV